MSEKQVRAYASEWITKINKTVYGVYWLGQVTVGDKESKFYAYF
jgi:hypothetical protein